MKVDMNKISDNMNVVGKVQTCLTRKQNVSGKKKSLENLN